MSETDKPKKAPMDPKVKLGFLVVFLAVAGFVVYKTWSGETLGDEWGTDLDAALTQAQAAKPPKRVVVFVDSFPVSHDGKRMVAGTLQKPKTIEKLQNCVLVQLTFDEDADWAKRYDVTVAPTTLVLSADGVDYHKQSGYIGEIDFIEEFLVAPLKPARGIDD